LTIISSISLWRASGGVAYPGIIVAVIMNAAGEIASTIRQESGERR